MILDLKGKSCLVTGGARGLGKAICESLAKEGVNIAVNYNASSAKAIELSRELSMKYGVKAIAVGADMRSENDVEDMFGTVIKEFGFLDFLVNNSGVCPTSLVKDMSLEEWQNVIDTNLTGTFLACRSMVRYLLENERQGKIVNICSQAAVNGSKSGKSHYAASKGGVLTFTNSLAKEVSKLGITVNAVSPGMIYTDMTADKLDEQQDIYNETIPIGRIASPEEVAAGVVFLCSAAASYLTGSNLDITGGMIGR